MARTYLLPSLTPIFFSISLVLTIVGFPIALHLAQAKAPANDRSMLIQSIQQFALRDADEDRKDTKEIIHLFQNNKAGLSAQQIAITYEEAYYEEAKHRKLPVGWLGWFFAAVAFLAWLFGDAIKAACTRTFNWLISRFLEVFAKARFAQRRALAAYRRDAEVKYRRISVPFRRAPLELRRVFVPLSVHGSRKVESTDAVRACEINQRLVVLGSPGAGKSVLLKHLMLHYSRGGFDHILALPCVVLLELRRFNELDLEHFNVRKQLLDALRRGGVKTPSPLLAGSLQRNSALLLLDGLDEVNTDRRAIVSGYLRDFIEMNPSCRVVVTCRTQVYNREFDDVCDTILEVDEFGDAQIRQFLDSWQDQMPAGKSADQLVAALADRPRILALARNPLLLTIIAYLYVDTEASLPHSRAEFYDRATRILIEEWKEDRNKFKASEKLAVLRHLALIHQQRAAADSQDRLAVPVDEILESIKGILPRLDLRGESLPENLLKEIVERSGLMISVDNGLRYQFAHLTLQEFFAASALRGDWQTLLGLFQTDPDRWRESIKLWCGLADNATPLIDSVFATEPFTALEGLADARLVDEAVANRIVYDLSMRIGEAAARTDAAQAFGALASDTRGQRGLRAFEFLKTCLHKSDREHAGAIASLAATNHPRAADILVQDYSPHDPQIRLALIQLGDLAVPSLASLVRNNSGDTISVIEDLQKIATEKAALELVSFLPNHDSEVAEFSAWALATFFSRPDVAQRLRQIDVLPLSTVIAPTLPSWGWIWKPFDAPTSALIPLVAVMAEFITRSLIGPLQVSIRNFAIDPRLASALLISHPRFQPKKDTDVSLLGGATGDKTQPSDGYAILEQSISDQTMIYLDRIKSRKQNRAALVRAWTKQNEPINDIDMSRTQLWWSIASQVMFAGPIAMLSVLFVLSREWNYASLLTPVGNLFFHKLSLKLTVLPFPETVLTYAYCIAVLCSIGSWIQATVKSRRKNLVHLATMVALGWPGVMALTVVISLGGFTFNDFDEIAFVSIMIVTAVLYVFAQTLALSSLWSLPAGEQLVLMIVVIVAAMSVWNVWQNWSIWAELIEREGEISFRSLFGDTPQGPRSRRKVSTGAIALGVQDPT